MDFESVMDTIFTYILAITLLPICFILIMIVMLFNHEFFNDYYYYEGGEY